MSTNFFQRQDLARKHTGRLVFLFALSIVVLIVAIYFVSLVLFVSIDRTESGGARNPFNLPLLLVVSAAVLMVTGCGSLYKIAELSSGGKSVAMLLGGQLIPPNTRELAQRRLLNVVEEMAIASGVPVPPVYLLANEPSINAFAAGFGPGDAVITVSQGCLDYLTRDELQGVLAHEFSHLLNGDVKLNIRLMGWVFGILALSIVGRFIIQFTPRSNSRNSDNNKGGLAVLLFGVALLVLGAIGAFFGRLIQAAVSRQREFLADASAVQFTRNPDGIGGALKKIGGLSAGATIKNVHAAEACHMFFADGVSSNLNSLLATHPPLEERIRLIDPHWDGRYPKVTFVDNHSDQDKPQPDSSRKTPWPTIPGMPQLPLPVSVGMLGLADTAERQMGTPTAEGLQSANQFTQGMTEQFREIVSEPFSARAAIYAMLLSDDPAVREIQIRGLQAASDSSDVTETLAVEKTIGSVPPGSRLTVAFQALNALSRMSKPQYLGFRDRVKALIDADRQVSLFEFCLQRVVCHHLDRSFGVTNPPPIRFTTQASLDASAASILGVLALKGSDSPDAASNAYTTGFREWNAGITELPNLSNGSRMEFDGALYQFEQATPQLKSLLLRACAECISADREVTAVEYELLRTICSTLDCPLPPLAI